MGTTGGFLKGLAWLLCLTGLYAIILAAITALNWSGADRIWLGALNLYLPQAMWAVPGILLAFFIFKVNPAYIWLPLLCVAWVLGPIMGFCWSTPPARPATDSAVVRVMTWNVKYGSYDLAPLVAEIDSCQPDVVLFQDAIDSLSGPLQGYFRNWQVYSHGQFLVASRLPLSDFQVHELPAYGEGQEYLRCKLHLGRSVVSLYNVHLKTPRRSLNAFRTARKQPWFLPRAIELFDHNVHTRLTQAVAVQSGLSRESGPVILAGDLNSPDASQACATLREAGLQDAFARQGRGYGFTYGHFLFKYRIPWLKISWMRIDHIMTSGHFQTLRCWAGTGKASDHRPVIADLVLQRP
jgi:vancomycin resistance protein VanJ